MRSQLRLSDVGSILYKGALVVHENMIKGDNEARKIQVGKVENVSEEGLLCVNWDRGAARGEYLPRELVVYDPY